MGDRRSRDKVECTRIDENENNFEKEKLLSPIEEESTTDPEENCYRAAQHQEYHRNAQVQQYKDYRNELRDFDQHRSAKFCANVEESAKTSSAPDSTSGEEESFQRSCCYQNREICDRGKLETEASGDNEEARLDNFEKSLNYTVKRLKARLCQCETELVALKKLFNSEKFRNRQYVLQCHEKHTKMQEFLKNELQLLKSGLENKVKAQIIRWQSDERKKLTEETAKLAGIYSQEVTKTLQKSMNDWQEEDSKKFAKLIQEERNRQDKEMRNVKKVYEKIQKHLENLEKRNKNSYLNLRKQIDLWEKRLKDEVLQLHESNIKFRQQPRVWHTDQNGMMHVSYLKSHMRSDDQGDLQRRVKDQDHNFLEDELLAKLRESNAKDMRKIEQTLKSKIQEQREEFTKLMTKRIMELKGSFEQFKHNFQLDREYQAMEYGRRMCNDDALETIESEGFTDLGTNTEEEEHQQQQQHRVNCPGKR